MQCDKITVLRMMGIVDTITVQACYVIASNTIIIDQPSTVQVLNHLARLGLHRCIKPMQAGTQASSISNGLHKHSMLYSFQSFAAMKKIVYKLSSQHYCL